MLIELKANTVSCRCPYHIVDCWSLLLSLRLGGKDQKITLQGDFFCIRSWIISYPSSTGIANVPPGRRLTLYANAILSKSRRSSVRLCPSCITSSTTWVRRPMTATTATVSTNWVWWLLFSLLIPRFSRTELSNNLVYICEESRKLILVIH